MAHIIWSNDLSVGIEIIDSQHKRIVDYLNELDDARLKHSREVVGGVIEDLIDYTQSHFGFEETLMEEAGYPYVNAHKKIHELFIRRINEYHDRFKLGDDVTEELHRTLTNWLVNHIKREDNDYSSVVQVHTARGKVDLEPETSGWLGGALKRFFGKKK